MAKASVVVLTRLTRLLVSAGRQMRNANGKITWVYVWRRVKPSDSAASVVALGIASMPERKISTLNDPAKQISDRHAQVKPLIKGCSKPRAFFIPGSSALN